MFSLISCSPQLGSKSSCDLTVVSEVRGATINSNNDMTDISIKKTTTILATEPNMSKTTEVTVVTRSPSKERRAATKSLPPASHHEVKLTYSAVSSPAHPKTTLQPVEVVRVPALEHAPILNPRAVDADADYKTPLPSTLSSASDRNGMASKEQEVKNTEASMQKPMKEQIKTEKMGDTVEVVKKEEVTKPEPKPAMKEQNLTKLLQNEAATHEKVGEIWKESQKVDFPVSDPNSKAGIQPNKQSETAPRPTQKQPQAQTYRSPQQNTGQQPGVMQAPYQAPQQPPQQRYGTPQQSYNQPPRPQYNPNLPRNPNVPSQPPGSIQRPPYNDNRMSGAEPTVRLATGRPEASNYQQDTAPRLK